MDWDRAHLSFPSAVSPLSFLLWVVPFHSAADGLWGHFGGQFVRWG